MENVSSRCGKSDNAPRLRFPEFRGEWLSTTLGAIGTFTKGAPLSKADIASEGTPFILYGELYTTYKEVTTEIKRRTLKTANNEYMSRVGDVIIPTSGETPDEIATATCIMVSNVILAGDLNIYRNSTIDGRFISYIINHVINSDISRIAQGKSVVHIKASELAKLRINYPSRQEQNKIIDFLMLLNRKITKQQSLINALKTYKRGVIDKFFCNNSYDFELYRLEEIGKFIRGLSYKEDEQTYDNQKTLVLRSNNIRDNGFLNYKEGLQFVTKIPDCEQLLQKNDLVFCMANGSSKLVGKNAVYDGRYNGKITVGTFCCIYRSKFHILQYYFQSSLFQKTLGKIQQGGGGSIGNLKPSDLEPLIVKLPNKYTQEKIFNCLSFFDSYIKLHENKLSSLLSLKSSLLQKMFI